MAYVVLLTILIMIVLHIVYFILGFALSNKYFKTKISKSIFWLSFLSFGFILIYTEYIWNSKAYTESKSYVSMHSSSKNIINISGQSDPRLDVEFIAKFIDKNTSNKNCYDYLYYPIINSSEYTKNIILDYNGNKSISTCNFELEKIYLMIKRHGDYLSKSQSNWSEVIVLKPNYHNEGVNSLTKNIVSCITKNEYGQNNIKLSCKINNLLQINKNNSIQLNIFVDEGKYKYIDVDAYSGSKIVIYILSRAVNKFVTTFFGSFDPR